MTSIAKRSEAQWMDWCLKLLLLIQHGLCLRLIPESVNATNVELYVVKGEECCNLFLTNKQRYHPHGNLQHQGSNLIRDLVNTISCVFQPTLLFAPSNQSQPTHGEHIPCRSRVMKSKPIKWITVRRRHDLSSKRLHENFFHEQAIKPTMTRMNK